MTNPSTKRKNYSFSLKIALNDGARCEKCGKQTLSFDSEAGFRASPGTICGICLSAMTATEFIERCEQKGSI